jgi:hypothetical protein
MAHTVTVYLDRDKLGAPADALSPVLRRALAEVLIEKNINSDGRIEVMLSVCMDWLDTTFWQGSETLES